MKASLLKTVPALLLAAALASACGEAPSADVAALPDAGFIDDGCGTDFDCAFGDFCIENTCVSAGTECVTVGDCADGEECHGGYCLEREGECEGDEGCPEGQICEAQRCEFGCRQDIDCGEGRMCNTNTNQCFTPPEDCGGACPMHTVCDTRTRECVSDGTCSDNSDCGGEQSCREGVCVDGRRCARNLDCVNGQWCDREEGFCEPGCRQANECQEEEVCVQGQCTETLPDCAPDAREPNDGPDEAVGLLPPIEAESMTLCDDEDWYQFTAFSGDEVSIAADFINDLGNINLQLFDPDDNAVLLVAGQEDGERLRRTLESTGTHRLRVFGAGRGVFNAYELSFSIARNCDEDSSEENDTPGEATPIDVLAGPLEDRFVCGADDDWYSVDLFAGEALGAALDFEPALGDLDFELYDAGLNLIEAADDEGDSLTLAYTAQLAEQVLLKVPGGEGVINRYSLSVEVEVPGCVEDGAEEDDGPEDPSEASPGDTIQGQICAGDEDWISLVLPADVTLRPTLSFTHAAGDLQLALIAADGETILAESDTAEDEESFEVTIGLPGVHFLRVRGLGRSQGAYTLSIEGGGESICPDDDGLEANDRFETPAALETGSHGDLILCGEDEDWFSFSLAEGQSVEVFALAASESGELSVALFGPEARSDADPVLDEVAGAGVVKRVSAQVGVPAGLYRVRVRAARGESLPYSVRLNVYEGPLPLDCEFDDGFEDNNIIADAARLGARQTIDGIVCGEDVDWFRFDAQAGEVVSVRIDFSHEAGDINLMLHGGMPLLPVAESASEDDGEFIQLRVEQSGPLFVEVSLAAGESAIYALTISRIRGSVPQSCVTDDGHEQNDSFSDAATVEPGTLDGVHCGTDDDYFALSLAAGQTLRARLLHEGEPGLELVLFGAADERLAEAEGLEGPVRILDFTAIEAVEGALAVLTGSPRDAAYTLTFEVLDAPPVRCGEEDGTEPDDDPGQATRVGEAVEFAEQSLCGADEDWYEVTVPSGMRLVAEARFDSEAGNVEAELYDQVGGGLGSSYSTSDLEHLELASENRERVVFVRVLLANPEEAAQVGYSLSFTFDNVLNCFPDEHEDNNNARGATRIAPGSFDGLSICAEDEDWYLVNVNDILVTLTIDIEFDGEAADLDLVLYEGTLVFEVARSSGIGDREQIREDIIFPGPYLIQVVSFDGGTSGYTMQVGIR